MQQAIYKQSKFGFTVIEVAVVVAILSVIMVIVFTSFVALEQTPQLDNTTQELISTLRLAQNQTLSSQADSQYGVYFNTGTLPQKYILFRGNDYASRNSSFDQTYSIPDSVEIYAVSTSGNNNEVVFDKLTGATENFGNLSVRLKTDNSQTRIIYIDNSGVIGFTPPSTPTDSRTKDSRHVDFNYTRTIDTTTENMVLTFNGNITEPAIAISQNLINGQINWTGTFSVNGSNQTISIHTLRLNAPDTQFSVFRDRRFNNASLAIKLSGDTNNALTYSADGLTTTHPSIYVDASSFAWQ